MAALSSWNGRTACSCGTTGSSASSRRSTRFLAPTAANPSTCVAQAAPAGGAALLEREDTRRVEELQPTHFELFTTTDDSWTEAFAAYTSATQKLDDLASLQAELMSTVATMDSMLGASAPFSPQAGELQALDLTPEARRAKRQEARAARRGGGRTASATAAAVAAPATALVVLEPPPAVVQPPTPIVQHAATEQPTVAVQQAAALSLASAPAPVAAANKSIFTRRSNPAPAPSAPPPQPTLLQQAGPSLLAPATLAARVTHQARAQRNSAGRAAVAKATPGSASTRSPTSVAGDGTSHFLKMASTVALLKPEEQKEVAIVVKDYLTLKSLEKELISILKRPPTLQEWAKAAKMEPRMFRIRLQQGQDAKALMLKANYRLVVKVVKPYQNRGLSLQDLITEGMHGLVKAVEKFEVEKGFRFSTYAHWWIRQAVTRAVQEQGRTVRLPTHLHEQIGRISMATALLAKKLGRAPTLPEIAQEVGLSADKVQEALSVSRPSFSLDVAVGGEDDSAEAKDQVVDERAQPDEMMAESNIAASIDAALTQALNPREAGVLRMHWGLDGQPEMTLEDIGAHFGVTRERVRQVEARALKKLKESQLALPAGVLAELQTMSAHEGESKAARQSRGTKKT